MKRVVGAAAAVMLGAGVTGAGYAVAAREPAGGPLGPGAVLVELDVHYSRFSRDEIVVRRGTVVRFVVRNDDPIRHELIVGPPEVHARHASGTEAAHPPVPGEVSVEPNAIGETVYRFDGTGSMTFACHLPGHFEYGMHGEVRVVD
jgi:uncharacterized cupredoxin-like copper-binding protein